MSFQLTPAYKRNFSRAVPFALIWLVTGWVFLFIEAAATGYRNPDPSTAITVTWPVFIFASVAVSVVGFLVGLIEVVLMEKLFGSLSLTRKIVYKFLVYLLLIQFVIFVFYPIAASIELGLKISDPIVWQKLRSFLVSLTFVSTLVQLGFSLLLSLFYGAISENLGHNVFLNFFTGKYHRAVIETRIFMFLDMKDSTAIAEQLGHVRYFDLLKKYYSAMSAPIVQHYGEVYQYVGDEVVVSWKVGPKTNTSNSIRCFFAIRESMQKQHEQFMNKFGIQPDFRAGIHLGEVTTGEIGALKKEIVFSGDVLNTTSRIQGLCKEYKTDLLISKELKESLSETTGLIFHAMESARLKGKSIISDVYSVESNVVHQ